MPWFDVMAPVRPRIAHQHKQKTIELQPMKVGAQPRFLDCGICLTHHYLDLAAHSSGFLLFFFFFLAAVMPIIYRSLHESCFVWPGEDGGTWYGCAIHAGCGHTSARRTLSCFYSWPLWLGSFGNLKMFINCPWFCPENIHICTWRNKKEFCTSLQ
jgi:hypothetical protein